MKKIWKPFVTSRQKRKSKFERSQTAHFRIREKAKRLKGKYPEVVAYKMIYDYHDTILENQSKIGRVMPKEGRTLVYNSLVKRYGIGTKGPKYLPKR